ncbi:serine O-acetyltransferase [Microcoleus vaginatus GB2-A3]
MQLKPLALPILYNPNTARLNMFSDLQIIYERDPAARNWLEVLFCYPGLQALFLHRIAHWLYSAGLPFVPRLISQLSRFLTGIEIHPGAKIGRGVFIDHGMGVVIGETAIVGDYAVIYQGATIGGTGKEIGKRHPTLGENVVVGAGAKVLGNIQIGNNARIGAGSVVLRDVPSDCTVVGIPGRIISRKKQVEDAQNSQGLPDLEAQAIRALFDRIKDLEEQVDFLKSQLSPLKTTQSEQAEVEKHELFLSSDLFITQFLDGAGI